jgi:hypothetical protein
MIRGVVKIELKNIETHEVEKTIVDENTITDRILDKLSGYSSCDTDVFISVFEVAEIPQARKVGVYESPVKGVIPSGVSTVYYTAWTPSSPAILEFQRRFDPPASGTRNITTVWMGSQSDPSRESDRSTVVNLAVPCPQTDTQYADITYQLHIYEPAFSTAPGTQIPTDEYVMSDYGLMGPFRGASNTTSAMNMSYGIPTWFKIPVADTLNRIQLSQTANNFGDSYFYPSVANNDYERQGTSNTTDFERWTRILNDNKSTTEDIGYLYGTLCSGEYNVEFQTIGGTNQSSRTHGTVFSPVVPDTWSPIQPVHSHNSEAIFPFLDVGRLATGSGRFDITAPTWDKDSLPEHRNIHITKEGDNGVANFYHTKMNTSGFRGNTYNARSLKGDGTLFISTYDNKEDDLVADEWKDYREHSIGYVGSTVLSWDATGIRISNLYKPGDWTYIDSTTTTYAPTNATGLLVDDSNNIWVQCLDTGLWKIDADLTTVTHFNNATHGITDGPCNAMDFGYNGRVWALFSDMLAYTDDGGTTWNHYSAITPITLDFSAGYSAIKFMRVDPHHPNHRMLFGWGDNTSTAGGVGWWSPEAGGTVSTNIYRSYAVFNNPTPELFYIWRRYYFASTKNIWMVYTTYLDNYYTMPWGRITPNSTTWTGIQLVKSLTTGSSSVQPINAAFFPDNYGTEYWTGHPSNSYNDAWLYDCEGDTHFRYNDRDTHESSTILYDSLYKFELLPEVGGIVKNKGGSFSIGHVGSQNQTTDPNAHRWNIPAEYAKTIYKWDGASWVEDLNVDAPDISGNAYHGLRKNFDPDSMFFNGRACVDVSAAFASGVTNAFTIPATFNLSSRSVNHQHPAHSLFSVHDVDNGWHLEVLLAYWDSTNSHWDAYIVEKQFSTDGTFDPNTSLSWVNTSTKIADAITWNDQVDHRAVAVCDGTTVELFIDGTSIGTHTLVNTTFDASATTVIALAGASNRLSNENALHPKRFLKGTMTNYQIWNVAWDATDIANDNADWNGQIVSKPAINMRARYMFDPTTIEGQETKTIPTGSPAGVESLADGIDIGFVDGATSPSWVAGDYYSYGVYDGIMKDNAISFNLQHRISHIPVEYGFTDVDETTVPSTASRVIKEPLFSTHSGNSAASYNPPTAFQTWDYNYAYATGASHIPTGTDGKFEWKVFHRRHNQYVGLTDYGQRFQTTVSDLRYAFEYQTNGNWFIRENGTQISGPTGTYTKDDLFSIEVISNIVYYKVNGGIVHTSAQTPSWDLLPRMIQRSTTYNVEGYCEAYLTHVNYPYAIHVGNETTSTGVFNPDFVCILNRLTDDIVVTVDGNPRTVTYKGRAFYDAYTFLDQIATPPAVDEVFVFPHQGIIAFNPADAGLPVSITANMSYRK